MARILITNNTLGARAGTELYVRDVVAGLLERGHDVVAYSTELGEVAQEMRDAGVTVVSSLDQIERPPDIIHGHHHIETMTALLRFHSTPAVYFCHGSKPWQETPPKHPRILRYVAVDYACYDRIVGESTIDPGCVVTIFNFADLKRFQPRPALPETPRRALIFSNNIAASSTAAMTVRAACERAGLELDMVGVNAGNTCTSPESILRNYDIVFAKGRSAIEALVVGSAVILCDAIGMGNLVTSTELSELRALNFGHRLLSKALDSEAIYQEIVRFDPADAASVCDFMRANAGLDSALDQIERTYNDVLDQYRSGAWDDRADEALATSEYVRYLGSLAKWQDQLAVELKSLKTAYEAVCSQLSGSDAELKRSDAELKAMKETLGWRLLSLFGPIKKRLIGLRG